MTRTLKLLAATAVFALLVAPAAQADQTAAEAAYAEIAKTFGGVPTFIKQMPKAAVAGAWIELRDLELSDQTALPPKTKALISLAVAAQIPCTYCVWADSATARQLGASDEEIGEAVAMAALTRHWSTLFNGLQVDFDTFKKELGGSP
jgi:AhpD family alkylhydroperoxidase